MRGGATFSRIALSEIAFSKIGASSVQHLPHSSQQCTGGKRLGQTSSKLTFCCSLHDLFRIARDQKNAKKRIPSSEFACQFSSALSWQNDVGQKKFDRT